MTADLRCDTCRTEIPAELWNQAGDVRCPFCRKQVWVSVYPAVGRQIRGSTAETLGSEGESSCFYHPNSRAYLACDSCGRFLCGLCDLDVGGRHICPVCLQQGIARESEQVLDNRRVLYDSITLSLALFGPMVFLWPSLITGPLSMVLVFWYWNRPRSIVPRTRIRFILAFLLGLSQLVFWGAIIWSIATARKTP